MHKQQQTFELLPGSSLCRFYLRGMCARGQHCPFAHGVARLHYQPYQHEREWGMAAVYRDFRAKHWINQLDEEPADKEYVNLYEFQFVKDAGKGCDKQAKIHTLAEISNSKTLKSALRLQLHHHEFSLFVALLLQHYGYRLHSGQPPGLDYETLEREYHRVGFNKLMTRMKFAHLLDWLAGAGWYKEVVAMVPCRAVVRTMYYLEAGEDEVADWYSSAYRDYECKCTTVVEQQVRNHLSTMVRPHKGIPHIGHLMKKRKITLKQLLEHFLGRDMAWVSAESLLREELLGLLVARVKKQGHCLVEELRGARPEFTGAMVEQCIRNYNEEQGEKLVKIVLQNVNMQIVTCSGFAEGAWMSRFINDSEQQQRVIEIIKQSEAAEQPQQLSQYKIVEVVSTGALKQCTEAMLSHSGILGIDIEGGEAYLAYMQVNDYPQRTIYIIDYLQLSQADQPETNRQIAKILSSPHKIKAIHDCRNDILTLLTALNTPFLSVPLLLDTALAQQCLTPGPSPGLNKLLRLHHEHPNALKQKYHRIWEERKQQDPALERPLAQEFREYMSRDVLGLPAVALRMLRSGVGGLGLLVSQLALKRLSNKVKDRDSH